MVLSSNKVFSTVCSMNNIRTGTHENLHSFKQCFFRSFAACWLASFFDSKFKTSPLSLPRNEVSGRWQNKIIVTTLYAPPQCPHKKSRRPHRDGSLAQNSPKKDLFFCNFSLNIGRFCSKLVKIVEKGSSPPKS